MTIDEVMQDYIGSLKQELSQRNVHIEQIQNQNAQLTSILVGTAGPIGELVPQESPANEVDAALAGGGSELDSFLTGNQKE